MGYIEFETITLYKYTGWVSNLDRSPGSLSCGEISDDQSHTTLREREVSVQQLLPPWLVLPPPARASSEDTNTRQLIGWNAPFNCYCALYPGLAFWGCNPPAGVILAATGCVEERRSIPQTPAADVWNSFFPSQPSDWGLGWQISLQ